MKKSLINKEELLKDYKDGMIQADILKKYKIGWTTLTKILNLPYKRYFRVPYDREQVLKDYKSGMPIKEILKKHNLKSYKNVYGIFHHHNVRRTKGGKKVWKKASQQRQEPTCPIILKLREKYRNTVDNEPTNFCLNLEPFITVNSKNHHRIASV